MSKEEDELGGIGSIMAVRQLNKELGRVRFNGRRGCVAIKRDNLFSSFLMFFF